jgi:hypothetical protein
VRVSIHTLSDELAKWLPFAFFLKQLIWTTFSSSGCIFFLPK